MQPTKIYGEWSVAIEFLNLNPQGSLLFDVGVFGSLSLFLSHPEKKYILGTWHGCMDDLLDAVVDYTKNPEHPNLVAEVKYENVEMRLAGTLTAANGQYRTAMELRTTEHTDAYLELHTALCFDCLQRAMDPAVFQSGMNNVTNVIDAVISAIDARLLPAHGQNVLALEMALMSSSEGLSAIPKAGTPEHDAYMRAYTNAATRLDGVVRDLKLDLCRLGASAVAGLLFPTVGGRLLAAMRAAHLRRMNQPIGPRPVPEPSEPKSPTDFSDSFPL